MFPRRLLSGLLLFFLAASLHAASAKTRNFAVTAPTDEAARAVAQAAEEARARVAVELVGQKLPDWPQPCPVTVQNAQGSGGATTFGFSRGQLPSMQMTVSGPIDKVVSGVVPHEVTHSVLADLFRRPVPRWADEGLAVCAEPAEERARHDKMCREILNDGRRRIPLARLLALGEYPSDVMALYAEGYSVTSFLVGLGGPRKFIQFLGQGMGSAGWDRSLAGNYGIRDVTALEQAWLEHLKSTKNQPVNVGLSGPGAGGNPPDQARTPPGGSANSPGGASPEEMMSLLREIRDGQREQKVEIQELRGRVEALERATATPPPRPPSALPSWNDRPPTSPAGPPGTFANPVPCPPGKY